MPDSTLRSQRAWRMLIILLLVVVSDQATKLIAIATLKDQPAIVFWGDLFRLQYAENTGAFLGLGSGMSESARFWLLTLTNGVILLAVAGYLFLWRRIHPVVALSLTLILSGGVGNIIDRIFRDGRVVDFMNMGLSFENWQLRTGIFNIADIAIMAGLFILIGYEFFFAPKPQKTQASDATSNPSDKDA